MFRYLWLHNLNYAFQGKTHVLDKSKEEEQLELEHSQYSHTVSDSSFKYEKDARLRFDKTQVRRHQIWNQGCNWTKECFSKYGGSTFEREYEGGALLSTGGLKVYIPLILKGV